MAPHASSRWHIFTEYVRSVQNKRGWRFGLTKRMIRFLIAALIIIIIIILLSIFLPIIIRAIIRHLRRQRWERVQHPFKDHPAYKRDPRKDHPSTEQCRFDVFSKYTERNTEAGYRYGARYAEDFEQLLADFNLVDEVDTALPLDFNDPMISGTVEIISIPYRVRWEPAVISSVATTKPWQVERHWIDYDEDTWILQSPSLSKGVSSTLAAPEPSCLSVWVGIYIPVGMEVGNWTTSLRSLSFVDHRNYVFEPDDGVPDDQQVPNGAIKVSNSTIIKSTQGTIDISNWNSRETTLETRRGQIRGKYAFYDSLNFKTLGGEVNVEVDPLGGARLGDRSHRRRLITSTGSGNTNVTVLPPSGQEWTPHFMESVHRTSSGSMQLRYPSEWAGTIEGVTVSGHADVTGIDVRKDTHIVDGPGEIHMMKGNRASDFAGTLGRIDLESEIGSIDIVIGDV